ncbi:transporter associated domain-containing protein [Metabacillus halosaccharovorans]|uniref:transporter associated domain-containing protein n=1 Tax=Metabacillus halosaccharovorans TaxID=930124 RepID=UPI0031F797A8
MYSSNKSFHTYVGGYITNQIGDIPSVKDIVQVKDLQLEIIDMDQFIVDKIMISKVENKEDVV